MLHNHCTTLIYTSTQRHTENIIYLYQPLSASAVALSDRAAAPMTNYTLGYAMENEHISLLIQLERIKITSMEYDSTNYLVYKTIQEQFHVRVKIMGKTCNLYKYKNKSKMNKYTNKKNISSPLCQTYAPSFLGIGGIGARLMLPRGQVLHFHLQIDGILPKGPYLQCVSMAGWALLAGYPRNIHIFTD